MKTAVRYYTRSGNTQRLARAVADAVGVEAATVETDLAEQTEVVFLGCSYYAFDVDAAVKGFICRNRDKIGQIVCFGTSAMMKSVRKPVEKVCREAGVRLSGAEFHCPGAFWRVHPGKPDADDLRKAAEFAKSILK